MRFEVPECRRFCFCVPLRYGLLLWSYLILIPNTLLVLRDFFEARYVYHHKHLYMSYTVFFTLGMILRITDYLLTVLLIVGAHMKNKKLLRIYFIAGLVSACLNFLWVMTENGYLIIRNDAFHSRWIYHYCAQFLLGIIYIVMQLYIIILVRSEIIKLEGSESFEFSNIAAVLEQDYYEPDAVSIEMEGDIGNGEEDTVETKTPEGKN